MKSGAGSFSSSRVSEGRARVQLNTHSVLPLHYLQEVAVGSLGSEVQALINQSGCRTRRDFVAVLRMEGNTSTVRLRRKMTVTLLCGMVREEWLAVRRMTQKAGGKKDRLREHPCFTQIKLHYCIPHQSLLLQKALPGCRAQRQSHAAQAHGDGL